MNIPADKCNPRPLVSVCIPVYNGRRFLEETIRSVLAQDYPELEVILQDNASGDGTWELLESLAAGHPRLSIERNRENVSMASNWNLALGRASGDYVMLLSADDLLAPGFLSSCLEMFAEADVDVVTTNHYWLDREGARQRKMRIPPGIHRGFAGLVLLRNPFSINFTLLSRRAVDRLRTGRGLFAVNLFACDYDLWFRIAFSGMSLYYIDRPLGSYRVHEVNLSRQTARMHRHAAMVVLRHKDALASSAPLAYRATLVRFMYRVLSDAFRRGSFDRWQFRALAAALLRRAGRAA